MQDSNTNQPTLKELGDAQGIMMGARVHLNNYKEEEYYVEVFKREYSLGTAGGDYCDFASTEPKRGVFKLDDCIEIAKLFVENGQQLMLKNLIWGRHNPDWLLAIDDYDEMDAIMKEHITTVMQGVRAAVGDAPLISWAVTNEVSDRQGYIPWNIWYQVMPDFFEKAFKYAREADPNALLIHNESHVVDNVLM